MSRRPGSSNQLRIIGGIHRGRKLRFADARGLRPTADRVRETLFNWIQHEIAGARCLDLFAGSGALGFEAASRGASEVVMIEADANAASALRQNIDLLKLDGVISLLHGNALSWLKTYAGPPFDMVFVDPPFADELITPLLPQLTAPQLATPTTLIYLERDCHQQLPELPPGWQMLRDKQAGQVCYGLLGNGV